MGTLLQRRGLDPGEAPETWNLTRPADVAEVAGLYADAGADLVHTNSFGGSPLKLAAHGLAARAEEINRAAAAAARRGAAGRALVSGSLGPCGRLLAPHGDADPDEVRAGFLLQAQALLAGGAALLTVETMIDLREALLAVGAAREAAGDGVVMATMTFEPSPRGWFTIMGDDVPAVVAGLASAGADVLGGNCGQGSGGLLAVAREFSAATALPLLIQPNAGLPALAGGEVRYPEDPAHMAAFLPDLVAAGVRIVGGCCGTTPAHIAALVRARDAWRDAR
jgi:5-methyltetrahydrofolate--homocysteine methyltransferase